MKQVNILGIEHTDISWSAFLASVSNFVADNHQHYLVTPNPEIVLKSLSDKNLHFILNHADLSLPDGVGLKLGARILGQKLRNRIPGADAALAIMEMAATEAWPVFLLGGMDEKVAEQAAWHLRYQYKNIKIVGHASGGIVEFKAGRWQTSDQKLLKKIQDSNAKILLVGFGCPKQEKWIFSNLDKLPMVKIAMTVGGTLDYWSGTRKRAPGLISSIGLEWLWRFIIQPSRVGRVWNATYVFIKTAAAWRFRMRFVYRKNAAGFIINTKDEVLLIQRANEKNEHWQFPQGGMHSTETVEQAARREIAEETGLQNLKRINMLEQTYKYIWPRWHSLNGGFRGQSQTYIYFLYEGKKDDVRPDPSEVSGYRWVYLDDVVKSVHKQRKEAAKLAVAGYRRES